MEVKITKNYIKELSKLPKNIIQMSDNVIEKLHSAKSLEASGVDYKKMEGQKKGENYYRIRVGDYRIGINNNNPKIIIITIIHRGKIYKHFPPR